VRGGAPRASRRPDGVAVGNVSEDGAAEALLGLLGHIGGVVADLVEQHACRLRSVGARVLLNLQPVRERGYRRLDDDHDAVGEDDR